MLTVKPFLYTLINQYPKINPVMSSTPQPTSMMLLNGTTATIRMIEASQNITCENMCMRLYNNTDEVAF
ncbi:hypothetical protein D3C86_1982480 [compost metagenome]